MIKIYSYKSPKEKFLFFDNEKAASECCEFYNEDSTFAEKFEVEVMSSFNVEKTK